MLNITTSECYRRISEFLDAHIDYYTEKEINYIRKNATSLLRKSGTIYISDILRQIYTEVGLIPEQENMYDGFVNLLENNFDINRNIVEVAGGIIPCLAKRLSLRQNAGTITVYDPRVIVPTNSPSNLILKRQEFTRDTQIPTAQMIIGFMPCDATIPAIESACSNELDFMLALCEGGARRGYEWLETEDEWLGFIQYIAKKGVKNKNMGTLEVSSLEQYGYPYPVIYNKRK